MASSFNGTGTRFYGEREYWPDGSYITTQWVSFVYIPLLPLRSLRLRHDRTTTIPQLHGIGSTAHFEVKAKIRLNWKQVGSTYLYLIAVAGLFLIQIVVSTKVFPGRKLPATAVFGILGFTALFAILTPKLLRWRASRAVSRRTESSTKPTIP